MSMYWNSVGDFIAMGGYGLYVWGSFGMALAVIVAEVLQLAARRKALPSTPQRTTRVATRSPHEA